MSDIEPSVTLTCVSSYFKLEFIYINTYIYRYVYILIKEYVIASFPESEV